MIPLELRNQLERPQVTLHLSEEHGFFHLKVARKFGGVKFADFFRHFFAPLVLTMFSPKSPLDNHRNSERVLVLVREWDQTVMTAGHDAFRFNSEIEESFARRPRLGGFQNSVQAPF